MKSSGKISQRQRLWQSIQCIVLLIVTVEILLFFSSDIALMAVALLVFFFFVPCVIVCIVSFFSNIKLNTPLKRWLMLWNIGNVILFVIMGTIQSTPMAKKMETHFEKHQKEFQDLRNYLQSNLPDSAAIDIRYKHGEVSLIDVNQGNSHFFMCNPTRQDLNSALKLLSWNDSDLMDLRKLMKRAGCIGIEYGKDSPYYEVAYTYVGLGKYSYRIYNQPYSYEEFQKINVYDEFVPYNDTVLFQYCSGAIGSLYFPGYQDYQSPKLPPHTKKAALMKLAHELSSYVRKAENGRSIEDIGMAVWVEGEEPIHVNGDQYYPMNSVMKLFQAHAVLGYMAENDIPLSRTVTINPIDWHHDTWSPMLKDYDTAQPVSITVETLLRYSLQQSDNNACDFLFSKLLPVIKVNKLTPGINIEWTEAEMHENTIRAGDNTCKPLKAAEFMLEIFNDTTQRTLQEMLYGCATGQNRLAKPLAATEAKIAHKTGTGFNDPEGNPRSLADVAYISLPNGINYSIAVFSRTRIFTMDKGEEHMAEISQIVYDALSQLQ